MIIIIVMEGDFVPSSMLRSATLLAMAVRPPWIAHGPAAEKTALGKSYEYVFTNYALSAAGR